MEDTDPGEPIDITAEQMRDLPPEELALRFASTLNKQMLKDPRRKTPRPMIFAFGADEFRQLVLPHDAGDYRSLTGELTEALQEIDYKVLRYLAVLPGSVDRNELPKEVQLKLAEFPENIRSLLISITDADGKTSSFIFPVKRHDGDGHSELQLDLNLVQDAILPDRAIDEPLEILVEAVERNKSIALKPKHLH